MKKLLKGYLLLPVQVKASLWALFCGILQKGISVITTPIFTRLLLPSEYGQYNVFASWMSIISIIISLNLGAGVFEQGLVKFENDKKVFASSLQGLSFTLVLFWTGIYFLSKSFWNKIFGLSTIQMVAMLLMIWLGTAFNFWAAEQKNQYRYKALVAFTLTTSVLCPVLSIIFIHYSNDKVTARIISGLLVALLFNTWLFIIQLKRGKKFFSAKYWKYALLFNVPLVPHYLSQVVLNNTDRIMIEKIVGESEAGIYSLAYSLSMIMLIFNTALLQTLGPWMYKTIKAKNFRALSPVAYSSLISVAAVNFLLISFAPDLIKIFAPPEYYDAIWVIPPVAISVFYIFSYDLFARFAFYYEKKLFITLASIVGAILNIILNFIFIEKFGYIAAGYTTLLCYIGYSIGHYLLMQKICNKYCNGIKPYNIKIIISIAVVFTVSGLAMLLTYKYTVCRYAAIALFFILILVFRKTIYNYFSRLLQIRKDLQ